MKRWATMGIVLLLVGCHAGFPGGGPSSDIGEQPSFEAIREAPAAHIGKWVLIGGELIAIRNMKETTEIEVLQKSLDADRSPIVSDQSAGRFLIVHPTFLDPTIFRVGRRITVEGKVTGSRSVKIGEAEMIYPVLEEPRVHLWPVGSPYRHTPHIGFGFGYSTLFGR